MKPQNASRSFRNSPERLFRVFVCICFLLLSSCSSLGQKNAASPWLASTPEEQGMDSKKLLVMLSFIDQQGHNLHSFLVLRHGVLVLEAYYPPFGAQDKHMLFSATKSVTSALVGIAIKEGKIKSVDQPVVDYFSDSTIQNLDKIKKKILLQDLLNMTSGLQSDDMTMGESQDWALYTINQGCIEPGKVFDYNTGNTQLLSAIIQKTTGKSTFEYAKEKLFEPLGIQDVYWQADPSGVTEGGTGLMLTPRDLAKFGYLFLRQGEWKGKQIVPAEGVQASSQMNGNGYANQWWQYADGYAAEGYAGQVIYVLPEKDIVVVSTAGLPEEKRQFAIILARSFMAGAAISDQPLPESPASQELARRLTAIANPEAQAVPELPGTAALVSGKTILLDDNPLGWKTARLDFANQQAWLTITTSAVPQEQKFAVGLDGNYRRTEQKPVEAISVEKPIQRYILNPYEFNFILGMPVNGEVAMKGEWSKDNEFLLTVQDIRDFDLEKLTFQFASPDVSIKWVSILTGTYPLVTLDGKLE